MDNRSEETPPKRTPSSERKDSSSRLPKYSRSGTAVIGADALESQPASEEFVSEEIIVQTLELKPPGKYNLVEPVGRGGMKTILKVGDKSTGRDVAMAVMNDGSASSPSRERFIKEARMTALLEHPNIVPVHEIGVDSSGSPYFTMKLISGEDLATILHRLDEGEASYLIRYTIPHLLEIFQKVCDAVAFAHSKGIIHLDLKPENIQVGEFGEVLVLDWGLSKTLKESKGLQDTGDDGDDELSDNDARTDATLDGIIKGTPGYMSPEQAAGKNRLKGIRTDIYALGAILYSMLTFKPPIEGSTAKEAIRNALHGKIAPARYRAPKGRVVPPALEFVAYKAMDRNPKRRYTSVAELKDDIDSYVAGYATTAEEAGLSTQIWLLLKRHRAVATLFVSALFVIAILLAYFMLHLSMQRDSARDALDNFKVAEEARTKAEAVKASLEERINSESKREWRLSFEESFRDAYVLERWTPTTGWFPKTIDKDSLPRFIQHDPSGIKVAAEEVVNFTLEESIPNDAVKIVYEATWLGGFDGGIHCIVHGSSYDEGYVFELGGWKNSKAAILRGDGQRVLAETPFSLMPKRRYKVEVEMVKSEGKAMLKLTVDGTELLSATDSTPAPPDPDKSFASFMTVASSSVFHSMKIFTMTTPIKDDILDVAERQLGKGNYSTAKDLFIEVLDSPAGQERKERTNSGLKLARLLEKHKSKIPAWELKLVKAWSDAHVKISVDRAGFAVELEGDSISDLTPIKGMPISALKVVGTSVSDLSPISKMELVGLDISNNKIKSLSPIKGMPLETLVCDFNPLGSLDALSGMSSLKSLSAKACLISSLKPLSGLPLASLNCSSNRIETLEPLRGLPLASLDCSNNMVASIEPLSGLPLQKLNIAFNSIDSLAPLSSLQIKQLDCSGNPIQDISHLKGMEISSLNCAGCSLTNINSLAGMPVQQLNLDSNKLSSVAPLEYCRELETVSMRWNSIVSLNPLKSENLISIRCDGNVISDISALSRLKSLKSLSMPWNSVSSLAPLSSLLSLTHLDCSENPLSGIEPLDSLSLEKLWCYNSRIKTFGKSMPFPPRRSFIFDSDNLEAADILRLKSSVGAGYSAKNLESSIAILQAFKAKDLKTLHRLAFKVDGRLFILVPTLRTKEGAGLAAKSLGGKLPLLKSKTERERISRQFSVDFWLDMEWRNSRVAWGDSSFFTSSLRKEPQSYGYFLSSQTGDICPASSERELLPLIIEFPAPPTPTPAP